MPKKNKNKDKDKPKAKDLDKGKNDDRPGRKDLARQIERLQAQNEALRARLDRIAEIASADLEIASQASAAVMLDEPEA